MISLTAAACEVVLQACYYASAGDFLFRRTHPPIYEADETRCFKLRPDMAYRHRTNEFDTMIYTDFSGHRTAAQRPERAFKKPAGIYRILLLGPSFAFGWGSDYEQTFGSLVERELRVRGKRVELINAGVPAQDPALQNCWLRETGRRYEPDLVLQTVYGPEIPRINGACPARPSCPPVIDGRVYAQRPTARLRAVAAAKRSAIVFYGFYLYAALSRRPGSFSAGLGKELYTPAQSAGGTATAAGYADFAALVREVAGKDAATAFLFIPASYVVHPEDARRWRHLARVEPEEARARIGGEAAALRFAGVPLIDATNKLIEAARKERMYYWLDIHLTPAGNRATADAVLKGLRELVPTVSDK